MGITIRRKINITKQVKMRLREFLQGEEAKILICTNSIQKEKACKDFLEGNQKLVYIYDNMGSVSGFIKLGAMPVQFHVTVSPYRKKGVEYGILYMDIETQEHIKKMDLPYTVIGNQLIADIFEHVPKQEILEIKEI